MISKFRVIAFGILIVSLFFNASVGYSKKIDEKKFKFFEWDNPIPRFSELDIDLMNLCSIIGDGQLLISSKGRDIELWTNDKSGVGEVRKYQNARFITSIGIIKKPVKEVRSFFLDFENYPNAMEQFTEGEILKTQDDQYLVRLKQVYKFLVLTLSADFKYLYKAEENGDLSVILIEGDVEAAALRIEFIPLDGNRTLAISTSWIDVDSAKLLYRTIMKAQPDLKPTAPIGASAMVAEQIRTALEGDCAEPSEIETLPTYPEIPFFSTSTIPKTTLEKLSGMGTLVFVHPRQWIRTDNGIKSVEFVSSAGQMPGGLADIKPLSMDFSRIHEYFDQAKKVEYVTSTDGDIIDWHFKFGFGFIGVGIDYTVKAHWKDENTVYFEGIKGDIDPLHGAMEWIPLDPEKTLVVFTAALQIGDNASWLLKLGRNVPKAYIISSLFMGTLIVEKQAVWLDEQLNNNPDLASK